MFVGWEPLAPGRNDGSFPIVCSPSSDLTLKCSIPAIRSSATKIGETQQLFSKPAINPHPMQQIHCFTTLQHSLRAQKKSCQCNKSPTRCNEYGFLGATNRHPYCKKNKNLVQIKNPTATTKTELNLMQQMRTIKATNTKTYFFIIKNNCCNNENH